MLPITIFCRLGKCEVCAINEAKYTCPKCEVKTCQIACLKIHKKELECDGIRDKTKFVPLKQMTKMDLMSDYNFLEECTRYVSARKRDKMRNISRIDQVLPVHLYKLRAACHVRKITLKYLLPHFSRHKENTTRLDLSNQKIHWKIQWNFLINGKKLTLSDDKCCETTKISELIWKYLDPASDDKRLEYYQSKGFDGIHILLKAEGVRGCNNRFYHLDIDLSLKENLAGKVIVEFPIMLIIPSDLLREFNIVDEDKIESERKLYSNLFSHEGPKIETNNDAFSSVKNGIKTGSTNNKSKFEELETEEKNLLFSNESYWDAFSDSE